VGSKDIGDGFIAVHLNSRIKNVFGAGSAYFVGGDAVGAGIDEGNKGIPKSFEAVGFEAAFED
jgi:hypothetical protein